MYRLLIDTNIYLRFYGTEKTTGLLDDLLAIKDVVFRSTQVKAEIDRNRVGYALQHFVSQGNQKNAPRQNAPVEHSALSADSTALRSEIEEVNNRSEALHRKIRATINNSLEAIADGEDAVSKKLSSLFDDAKVATGEQFLRAQKRKEIGNPPGKPGDPLGDQLIWEQFLEHPMDTHIWIVTGDRDYTVSIPDKPLRLNPVLSAELKRNNPTIDVRCFDTLGEALLDYKQAGLSMPSVSSSEQSLREAAEEERLFPVDAVRYRPGVVLDACPNCLKWDSWEIGPIVKTSDGTQYVKTCTRCFHRFIEVNPRQ